MMRKLGWFLFLAAVLCACTYLVYKVASPYIWPLPFDGPYRGEVRDTSNQNPIRGAEVEAAWLIHDNPLPDGPGHFFFRKTVRTDAAGRFEIDKPFRRRGFFGTDFVLTVRAPGYIEKVHILDPKNTPLPSDTEDYPFVDTSVHTSLPMTMVIGLSSAKPVLIETLTYGASAWLRSESAVRLGNLAPQWAEEAVPALIASLGDDDATVREQACTALGLYGTASVSAIQPLAEKLKDPSEWVRRKAAEALGRIGAPAAQAVDALAKVLLSDSDRQVRQAAAEALGEIGPPAADAIPALKKAVTDPEGWVGRAAKAALEKVMVENRPAG